MNRLKKIAGLGQSVWLDYIDREFVRGGDLDRLIREDGLSGMTSNPKIFQQAIARSDAYHQDILEFSRQGLTPDQIFEALGVRDVQSAADRFRELHDRTAGEHGYVSLEVNPHLARDAAGTIGDARRLWQALDRPNVFIKVPATEEGLLAIRHLIDEGINVNVTLLFGLPRYRRVVDAYMRGLESRWSRGKPIDTVRSVASFFLSRIDVLVDTRLEEFEQQHGGETELTKSLKGETAIASARVAYQQWKELHATARWHRLAERGARPQRLLWASTGTKNPAYSDIRYVEPLIGPDTVNTMPRKTLDAYRDHGDPRPLLEDGVEGARNVLASLGRAAVDLDEVTRQLEVEGIEKFVMPYDQSLEELEREVAASV